MSQSVPLITILSFSPIHRDARVLRQVRYLWRHFRLRVVGYGAPDEVAGDISEMVSLPMPAGFRLLRRARTLALLLLGRILPRLAYESWYWGREEHKAALTALIDGTPRAIHANDWTALPAAIKASEITGAQVILDLHEYSPEELENRWFWRVLYKPMVDYFLRTYASGISAAITVSGSIAKKYWTEYSLRPIVVMNAPECPGPPEFRSTDPSKVRLIHHGGAVPDRRLELMIETVARTKPRYTLHFMLTEPTASSRKYVSQLKSLARQIAPGRVFFHDSVPPSDIIDTLSAFDMGIYLLPPNNFNHMAALPNKFFDFVAAGLSVCIGPSPEMTALTRHFGFGVVACSFEPERVADILNKLSASDIDYMKLKAGEARKILNADVEMGKLTALYSELCWRQ